MKKVSRLQIELAGLVFAGLVGIGVGASNNPHKVSLTGVLGILAGSIPVSAYFMANDKQGILKLENGKLQRRVTDLKSKIDAEYVESQKILEILEGLRCEKESLRIGFDAERSELTDNLDKAVRKGLEYKKLSESYREKIEELSQVVSELNLEVGELSQNFDERVASEAKKIKEESHRKLKKDLVDKGVKMFANYERHREADKKKLTEQFEIEIGKYQERISELNSLVGSLEETSSELEAEKNHFENALKKITQTDFPDIQSTFEKEWDENNLKIENALEALREANVRLARPRMFPGLTGIDSVGNRIINHFYQYGVTLDAVESVKIKDGFKLRFKCDRTNESTKLTEEEFDKRSSEPGLMGLSMGDLDFDLDTRNFIVSVDIATALPTTSKKPSKGSQESLESVSEYAAKYNYLKGVNEFSEVVKTLIYDNKVPSIRVNGGSGSGKSSLTRLILGEAIKTKQLHIRLHDPQDGSTEDRWGLVKVSATRTSATEAIKTLESNVESKLNPASPQVDVFDEIDGMVRSDAGVKKAYLTISTQVRHLSNQFLIVIGQSPNVKRNGLEWADMDSIGCIYIGDSAIQAIKHSPKLEVWHNKLSEQYQELLDESTKSEETDSENFFRFALVVLPGKKPFWMELPEFTTGIEGYKASTDAGQNTDKAGQRLDIKEFGAVQACGQGMDRVGHREDSVPLNGLTTVLTKCPDCGSENVRSKGDRWACKDCKKTWKK